jgi:hypothetical protein
MGNEMRKIACLPLHFGCTCIFSRFDQLVSFTAQPRRALGSVAGMALSAHLLDASVTHRSSVAIDGSPTTLTTKTEPEVRRSATRSSLSHSCAPFGKLPKARLFRHIRSTPYVIEEGARIVLAHVHQVARLPISYGVKRRFRTARNSHLNDVATEQQLRAIYR